MTKEEAKQKIAELVEKYQKLTAKEIKGFNEEATKQAFIQPMFRALGWDFENTNEVSPEEHASNGRVDYAFKLNNVSQFYIEAKSLKADLNREDYIKQSVSYSYARGVIWAVLTDFESLRVFNALQNKPFISLSCLEYLNHFDDVCLLSRQAFTDNELNKKAQAYGAMPPFIPIEKRLFKQLSQWRENLFNEIYRYNPEKKLEREQVDGMIQKLFNRLIFIRTCEDRRIEENGIRALLNQWKTGGSKGYLSKPLRALFKEYEGYYDSELFSHHLLDEDIFIDNESLQPVLEGLYEIPGSLASYNFNDIDADVLGAVYEQYLGHIAEAVKQQAKNAQTRMSLGIETPTFTLADKKEHRKEHGIYYTPKYITDYIVKETVGRFLQENAGYTDKLRNLKILDPACGSGSFLIRAYDELLNYHANELKKPVHALDQWERLPILTNNIYGVDLDKQAVEVARLNLLLRSLAKREPLPYLGDNIKNGNSLISGNEEELKKYFGDNWKDKNPFNWDDEFKDIMKNGGFDVVIGNPPYVFTRGNHFDEQEKQFYKTYKTGAEGKLNLFSLFIEKGMKLLKEGGVLGFIVPNNLLRVTTYKSIRDEILLHSKIVKIVDLSSGVFDNVTASTVIIILQKDQDEDNRHNNMIDGIQGISDLNAPAEHITKIPQKMFYSNASSVFNIYSSSATFEKFQTIEQNGVKLGIIAETIIEGIVTPNGKSDFISDNKIDDEWKHYLEGKDIRPYYINYKGKYIRYNRELLHRPRPEKVFNCPEKLICQRIGGGNRALTVAFDNEQYYTFASTNVIILKPEISYNLKYILGILNSRFLNYYYLSKFTNKSELTVNISKTFLSQLPIKTIDFTNDVEKKKHDLLVVLVDKMIKLNKDIHMLSEYEIDKKQELEKEIKATDKKIDNLVYNLYGLTEEEIKIVEEGI